MLINFLGPEICFTPFNILVLHDVFMVGISLCNYFFNNRPFPYSTSVGTNNRTIARLGWTFSYICCIFVHLNLDSVPSFVGMRERSIKIQIMIVKSTCSSFVPYSSPCPICSRQLLLYRNIFEECRQV